VVEVSVAFEPSAVERRKFTASIGVNGLSDLLAEKGYDGRVKSGFIALDLAYWRMR
jgi:hypothetical protein